MDFNTLMMERRSIRSYQKDKKVTEAQITEMIKAAQMAPTWKNSQTGRYYAALDGEKLQQLREKGLPSFNQNSSDGAALIVTTFVKDVAGHTAGNPDNELGNMWGAYDLGLQNAYLVLKAKDLGLDTLIMGIRDSEAIREMLDIPEEEIIVSVIAVGYRNAEPVMRQRKACEEIAKICE